MLKKKKKSAHPALFCTGMLLQYNIFFVPKSCQIPMHGPYKSRRHLPSRIWPAVYFARSTRRQQYGHATKKRKKKLSPSGLSTFLAQNKKCFFLSTQVANIFSNLLKQFDDSCFLVSIQYQLFSGKEITVEFATQGHCAFPIIHPYIFLMHILST